VGIALLITWCVSTVLWAMGYVGHQLGLPHTETIGGQLGAGLAYTLTAGLVVYVLWAAGGGGLPPTPKTGAGGP